MAGAREKTGSGPGKQAKGADFCSLKQIANWRSPSGPGARAAHHVHVQMRHFLAAFRACVHHHAKAPFGVWLAALLQRQAGREEHDAAHQPLMLAAQLRHGGNVRFGHDEKVHSVINKLPFSKKAQLSLSAL